MDEDVKGFLIGLSIFLLTVIIITVVCCTYSYVHKKIQIENFEATIENLSEEQKCLHICGFKWDGKFYFDNYKYCVEKCDRISERSVRCGNE